MIGSFIDNEILFQYEPTGCSERTSLGERLLLTRGVGASRVMAARDYAALFTKKALFVEVAQDFELPPALLAAIASRESRAGRLLDKHGFGDKGHAFGWMQVDVRSHTVDTSDPASLAHIGQAGAILHDNLLRVTARHPDWSAARQLQGAVAAYNFGPGNVKTLAGIDNGTTHDDYSNDVWARAWFLAGR